MGLHVVVSPVTLRNSKPIINQKSTKECVLATIPTAVFPHDLATFFFI